MNRVISPVSTCRKTIFSDSLLIRVPFAPPASAFVSLAAVQARPLFFKHIIFFPQTVGGVCFPPREPDRSHFIYFMALPHPLCASRYVIFSIHPPFSWRIDHSPQKNKNLLSFPYIIIENSLQSPVKYDTPSSSFFLIVKDGEDFTPLPSQNLPPPSSASILL